MKKRKRKRIRGLIDILVGIGILLLLLYLLWIFWVYKESVKNEKQMICDSESVTQQQEEVGQNELDLGEQDALQRLQQFAKNNGIPVSEYPDELLERLQKNPETEKFVLNYPLKKGTFSKADLTELNEERIPLLMQWDDRWGYYKYGDNVMGLTGCGPTCLSMVASFLKQDPKLTPIYMADYAIRNGYCVSGSGTSWNFMSDGAREFGLQVQEIPLMKNRVYQYLQEGNPIICIMGPGEFTDNGHFIVLTEIEEGKIKINDPNSKSHSNRLWEFEEIESQIRNMWVYQ